MMFAVQTLRSHLKLICGYELHILPNTKVGAAKDHDEILNEGPPSLA